MKSEIQERAEFSEVRYGQCWEDADILVEALKVHEERKCLSIGSAGDNSFALLAAGASHVTAVEMNPAQVACIERRKNAYLNLDYDDFLREVSSSTGKFEDYFRLFRTRVLPLAHSKKRIRELLEQKSQPERESYYQHKWNNWRWRTIFRIFFSRFVMGRLGRDPVFFDYVEGKVADNILERTRYALTKLDPSQNPYLHWILTGHYGETLPLALQRDSYEKIRNALKKGRFKIIESPLETVLQEEKYDAFNLSDIFEYMSDDGTQKLLEQISKCSNSGARLAYWNMLAPRSSNSPKIKSHPEEAKRLFLKDRAFFYSNFIIEEIL